MDKSNPYYSCAVPECKSNSKNTPNKLFINVPFAVDERRKWLQLANRKPNLSSKTKLLFCEDHFDLSKDMANYMEYTMGFSKKIRMIENCLPSKFECQLNQQISSQTIFDNTVLDYNQLNLNEENEKSLGVNEGSDMGDIQNVIEDKDKHSLDLLVEMKRQPTTRKRKLTKNKSNKAYRLPKRQKPYGSITLSTNTVWTQTDKCMDWKKFLTPSRLDRYSMRMILGLPSLSDIIQFLKSCNVNENLMKIQNQLILTIWKYRFNLNFDSYSHMFSFNEKISSRLKSNVLNDIFVNFTENLYKYTQRLEEIAIEDINRLVSRRLYLDVIEIPVMSHLNFDKMNYSNQRGTTTFKAIVLFTSVRHGILYISDLYGGSTNISHIIRNSKIKNIVRSDDYIMYSSKITPLDMSYVQANIIDNAPEEKKVIFNEFEKKFRKFFKILNDPLPIHYWSIANKLFYNCMSLFNTKFGFR